MKSVTAVLLMLLAPSCAAFAEPSPTSRPMKLYGAEPGGLYEAVVRGDADAVRRLLASGAKPDANRDQGGGTPLMEAGYRGNVEVMRLLIDRGADVNAETRQSGYSPLQTAADGGHLDAAKLLVEKGADVRHRDKSGGTPLYNAVQFGRSTGIAKLLIEQGSDVNAALRHTGATPLHCAVAQGDKELVELLVADGADVNARESFHGEVFMPLAMARERAKATGKAEYQAIADLLVAHGTRGRDRRTHYQARRAGRRQALTPRHWSRLGAPPSPRRRLRFLAGVRRGGYVTGRSTKQSMTLQAPDPTDLTHRVEQLLTERRREEALGRIDKTLSDVGAALVSFAQGGPAERDAVAATPAATPAKNRRGGPAGDANFAWLPAAVRGGRRARGGRCTRGSYPTTGEESVLGFIKRHRNPTTAEIKAHWAGEGRLGTADNVLSKLFREKRVRRTPLGKGLPGAATHCRNRPDAAPQLAVSGAGDEARRSGCPTRLTRCH